MDTPQSEMSEGFSGASHNCDLEIPPRFQEASLLSFVNSLTH